MSSIGGYDNERSRASKFPEYLWTMVRILITLLVDKYYPRSLRSLYDTMKTSQSDLRVWYAPFPKPVTVASIIMWSGPRR